MRAQKMNEKLISFRGTKIPKVEADFLTELESMVKKKFSKGKSILKE